MSRLCRLKTASPGDDGQWAYNEIVSLRKQRDELLAALERCRFALEPYDDIKPRDWKSDRLNLRSAHQIAVAAILLDRLRQR